MTTGFEPAVMPRPEPLVTETVESSMVTLEPLKPLSLFVMETPFPVPLQFLIVTSQVVKPREALSR
ncbi:MAG: hypothetical protein IJR36_07795, partial [Lachnospiraceae bacterium]|nr:hypothetical protein [Lachnospiraceae bacterium]